MRNMLKINNKDNVAVALFDISANQNNIIDDTEIKASEKIASGHKIALNDIGKGEIIIKYGYAIGHAMCDIRQGDLVHTHNLKTNLSGKHEYKYNPLHVHKNVAKSETFLGYERKNGTIGIRNEIWIIPTVGCVNGIARQLERLSVGFIKDGIDGVYAYCHPYGCSQMGQDHKNTQKLLAGLVHHPNAAAVLVLGLGCENNNIEEFKKTLGKTNSERVHFLQCQDVEDEIDEGLNVLNKLCYYALKFKRKSVDISKLIVGLKCGGSDGFSGITANPLVGVFSDRLNSLGGTAILTEVPEMFGAETLLMDRCKNIDVFNKTVSMINDFKDYYTNHGQVVYDNPSPGNKDGGITTLEEKSLGCTQKSGQSMVCDVVQYAQPVKTNGLNLLSAPGNDIVAVTALAASGAHVILFTTGRGNPLGSPVPTVKISTNTNLYQKKKNWIDFNAGDIINGQNIKEFADDLFDYVIKIANGNNITKTEASGYREISIFKDGVIL